MGVGPITPVITIVGVYLGGVKFQSIAKTGSMPMPKKCHSWVSSSLHGTHLCNHHVAHSCKTSHISWFNPPPKKNPSPESCIKFQLLVYKLLAIGWVEPVLPQNGAFFHQQTQPLTDDRFPNNISQPPPCWPQIQRMRSDDRLVNHPYIWTFDHDDVIWDHQV